MAEGCRDSSTAPPLHTECYTESSQDMGADAHADGVFSLLLFFNPIKLTPGFSVLNNYPDTKALRKRRLTTNRQLFLRRGMVKQAARDPPVSVGLVLWTSKAPSQQ